MAKTTSKKKDRGKFLAAMLFIEVYELVHNAPSVLSHFSIGSVLQLALNLLALYGIWTWRRWAVYLLFFMLTVTAVTLFADPKRLFMANSPFGGYMLLVIVISVAIGEAGLWFWAISRKWQYFE